MTSVEFSSKFTNLQDLMFGFAMRLTQNREDAKDLMQETALKAYANINKFKSGTNFKAWISTIMRNSFINKYRRKKTRNEIEQPIEEVQFLFADKAVQSAAYSNIGTQEILGFLGGLTQTYQIPFLLHFQGYEYKEIASHLDIPIGTVKSRIHFARTKLKSKINRYYC